MLGMASRSGSIHVAKIERKHKGRTYVSHLLRRSYREDGKVKHETLGNVSHLPPPAIEALRRVLKGETLVPADQAFHIERSLPHGHVEAVIGMIRQLGLETVLAAKRSRQRDLVLAMIVQRVVFACSKLATTRHWHSTTLADELGVGDADEEELYEAMDWLVARQPAIESKLADRHLSEGSVVLYDVSSSYYTGHTCPLAAFGHSRDQKKGRPIIVYGVLTDREGRPVAVDVYPGNTGDPTTVPDQVEKLRERFGFSRIVLVGDRGMLTQTQISKLKEHPELGWISALRSPAIRKLIEKGDVSRSLFDETALAEICSPDFPDERLVACFNPLLAEQRARKREELLVATEKDLDRLAREVSRRKRKPMSAGEIGLKAGRIVNRFKMAKHFTMTITDAQIEWQRNQNSIDEERRLDGIYVIRTSESEQRLSAADTVRTYKRLGQVEQAFRSLKSLELLVRPIHHRAEQRVRAHIFLCLLAYYVQWHLKQAWAPLLFRDEELADDLQTRDPVAPAQPSTSVKVKKQDHRTLDGLPVHSFRTLLSELGTRCRNICRLGSDASGDTFSLLTELSPVQAKALELLKQHARSQNATH